jgi:hypothetical protein
LKDIITSDLVYARDESNNVLFVCVEVDFIGKLMDMVDASITRFSLIFPNGQQVEVEKVPLETGFNSLNPLWIWNLSSLYFNCFITSTVQDKQFLYGLNKLLSTLNEAASHQDSYPATPAPSPADCLAPEVRAGLF